MRPLHFALLLALIPSIASAQSAPTPIRAGAAPIERTLAPGVPHVYTVTVGAAHFVRGQADQRSVDVIVRVLDPSGAVLATFDDPARGPETFRFTTAVAGEHRIEVTGFENDSGTYVLRLDRAEPFATDPAARVDQIMSDYDPTSPGGVVAVVRNGDVEFVRGYGMANLEYGIPNGPETVFHMASVSKQFTAFAILLLAEQGLLSLDDDIRAHLPEMADFGTPITIRHLVHHTSGLRDQWTLWAMAGGRMDDVITHGDLLSLIFRQKELNFAPGSEHLYSNTGYSLMAEIVERVSGEPFGAWMRRTVFDPLGMNSTQIYDDHERIVPNRAYSYHRDRDGRWAKSVLSYANRGATSLFTTARDLARWVENYRTGQVGGASVIAGMKQRGVLTNGDTIPYAFAIAHGRYRGLDMLQHGGADAGYRTALAYFPALDAGVIVLSNDAGFNPGAVARDVAAAFFADHMTAAQPNPAPPSQPARPELWKPTAEQLQAYAGVYYSPELETRYTVRVSDGALVAVHRRHGDLAMRPVEQDRFNVPTSWFFTNVRFERAADGSVTSMRVSSGRVRNLLFERLRT